MQKDEIKNVSFWPVMFAIFIGSFLTTLSTSTINIAIPVLQHEFNTDLVTVQWTLTGFMLAMGTFAPISGYLGERFSYKYLYFFAMLGFTIFSVMCALSWNAQSLVVFRIFQGAFSGLVVPSTMAVIYQVIPREKQAFAVSLWGLSAMLAPALGPTFGGWLIEVKDWHWLFWINVPVGIIALVLIAAFIPYYRLQVPKSFDFPGLITVMLGSSALLVALAQGHSWGWSSWKILTLFIGGVVMLVLFVWRELTAETPLLNLRVLKDGRYTITLIVTSIVTISLFSGTFLTPVFLENIQRVSAMDTGLILLPSSLVMALFMPVVGKLYHRIGPRILMAIGVLLIAAGSLPLSWLSVDVPHSYILLWMIVRNLGIALTMMPASNAGMEQIPLHLTGHASSLSNWIRNVLGSFAIAIFTSLLYSRSTVHAGDMIRSGVQSKQQIEIMSFTMSVNDVYLIATLIAVAALPFALLVNKRPKPQPATLQTTALSE
jgi:EmrB/QacA subfamily drug resistance transporter